MNRALGTYRTMSKGLINVYIIGIPQRQKENGGHWRTNDRKIPQIWWHKYTDSRNSVKNSAMINSKKTTPRYIIIKLLITNDEEKTILKPVKNYDILHKGEQQQSE